MFILFPAKQTKKKTGKLNSVKVLVDYLQQQKSYRTQPKCNPRFFFKSSIFMAKTLLQFICKGEL